MTPPPTSPPHTDAGSRLRLLSAARSLFLRKGFAETSVNEIVSEAGVSKPVLYYYFESKEAIYIEIVRGAYDGMRAVLDTASEGSGSPAKDRLLALSSRIFDFFLAHRDTARLIYAEIYGHSPGIPIFNRESCTQAYREAFGSIVDDGLASGEFAGPRDTIITLVMAVLDAAMAAEIRADGERLLGRDGLLAALELAFHGFKSTNLHPIPTGTH